MGLILPPAASVTMTDMQRARGAAGGITTRALLSYYQGGGSEMHQRNVLRGTMYIII